MTHLNYKISMRKHQFRFLPYLPFKQYGHQQVDHQDNCQMMRKLRERQISMRTWTLLMQKVYGVADLQLHVFGTCVALAWVVPRCCKRNPLMQTAAATELDSFCVTIYLFYWSSISNLLYLYIL